MPPRVGTTALARKIGARIRALRIERAITQERLAWDTDSNKGYLSQVESGKRLPSLAVLLAIARRLGVELVDVVALDQKNPRVALLDALRRGDVERARGLFEALAAEKPRSR
jgi:transcriptional regulator with XRE-family HTH domain